MMNALAIIPNENKLEVDPFYHDLEEGERHGKGIRKLFKEHKHFFTKYKKRLSYVVSNEIGEIIEASEYLHSDSYHNLFNYIKNEETRESELKR